MNYPESCKFNSKFEKITFPFYNFRFYSHTYSQIRNLKKFLKYLIGFKKTFTTTFWDDRRVTTKEIWILWKAGIHKFLYEYLRINSDSEIHDRYTKIKKRNKICAPLKLELLLFLLLLLIPILIGIMHHRIGPRVTKLNVTRTNRVVQNDPSFFPTAPSSSKILCITGANFK